MDIIIREMTVEDVPQVAVLEASKFSMPWSEKAFYEQLNNEHALYMVAVYNEMVLGVCEVPPPAPVAPPKLPVECQRGAF